MIWLMKQLIVMMVQMHGKEKKGNVSSSCNIDKEVYGQFASEAFIQCISYHLFRNHYICCPVNVYKCVYPILFVLV